MLPILGFEPLTSQVMVVKHMTVRVRSRSASLISALEKSTSEGAATGVIRSELKRFTKPKNGRARPGVKHKIFMVL